MDISMRSTKHTAGALGVPLRLKLWLLSFHAVGMYEPLYLVMRGHLYTIEQALPTLELGACRIWHFARE